MTCFLLAFAGPAFANVHTGLPYSTDGREVKSLYQLVDKELERKLTVAVTKSPDWKALIKQKKMAVGIVDISDPKFIRFARINGSVMMYAASLPKIAVLLAAEQTLEDGLMEETAQVKSDMRRMISRSDNKAATRMIDLVGLDRIEKVLTDPRYKLYNKERGGGLWVGRRYAATGERHPDPMLGLSHAATVSQVCRFYYLLAMGKLVSPERSKQMLEILSEPELHHKFVGILDRRAPDAMVFRKSGTWKNWHSDSVLVWGPAWRRYIAVALVESPKGDRILKDLMVTLDTLLEKESLLAAKPGILAN